MTYKDSSIASTYLSITSKWHLQSYSILSCPHRWLKDEVLIVRTLYPTSGYCWIWSTVLYQGIRLLILFHLLFYVKECFCSFPSVVLYQGLRFSVLFHLLCYIKEGVSEFFSTCYIEECISYEFFSSHILFLLLTLLCFVTRQHEYANPNMTVHSSQRNLILLCFSESYFFTYASHSFINSTILSFHLFPLLPVFSVSSHHSSPSLVRSLLLPVFRCRLCACLPSPSPRRGDCDSHFKFPIDIQILIFPFPFPPGSHFSHFFASSNSESSQSQTVASLGAFQSADDMTQPGIMLWFGGIWWHSSLTLNIEGVTGTRRNTHPYSTHRLECFGPGGSSVGRKNISLSNADREGFTSY